MIKYDYEQINKSEFAEGLVMIHYDIDTTENGYKKFEGNIELLIELKHILFKNDVVPDLVGYLSFDNTKCFYLYFCTERTGIFYQYHRW